MKRPKGFGSSDSSASDSSDIPKGVYANIELFPTLVWKINLDWKFNKKEKQVFTKSLKETRKNALGNLTSENTYILDEKPLLDFKEHIYTHLNNYFHYAYKPLDDIKPIITQSWTNLTQKGMYHDVHSHANSFLSSVYYYKTQKQDKIKFFKPDPSPQLSIETSEWGTYNALSWAVPVSTGDLIIFPSYFKHSVAMKEEEGDRISLAINAFLKGTLASSKTLTELKV